MRPEKVSGEAGFEVPSPLTRVARITRIIAYAGLFALILLAFVVAFLRAWGEAWAIAAFVVVGLSMVAGIAFNFEGVADAVISRKTAIGANSVLMVALAFALLAMVSYLSARHHVRADLTSSSRFTLDDRTQKLLARLDSGLEIATFMVPPQFRGQADLAGPVRDLLEQCEVESGKVKVKSTFLLTEPREAVGTAERLGFSQDAIEYNCILMAYKGNTKKLSRSDLVDETPPSRYGPPPEARLKIEDAISSAIRELMEEEERVIYAIAGHGERPMTGGQRNYGLSLAKAELRGQNYDVRELKLAEKSEVPDDASAVLISGPRRSFTAAEVDILASYLDGGGAAVVFLDSTLGVKGMSPSGLADFLEERGIKVRQDVEVKQIAGRFINMLILHETIPAAWYSQGHPITKPLVEAGGLVTHYYRPCALEKTDPEDSSLVVEELVKTHSDAWCETSASGPDSQRRNAGAGDAGGPIVLAIASCPRQGEKGGKLVVVADSDFASDAMYREAANGDLFINSVNWMTGVKENIGIESRVPDIRSANMTDRNKNRVFWIDVVLVPFLVLACGAVVFWLRRK